MNILFRADSSSKIGTGHIMRDLVLAKQFPHAKILFATQDLSGNINHKITEAEYEIINLKTNDKEELIEVLKSWNVDLLAIDHYEIDYKYESYIKENFDVKILALDDTYEKHNSDILLNHNISADKQKYKGLVPKDCELRCGSKYTLLREEFLNMDIKEKNIYDKTKFKVFIAIGGADSKNMNIKILEEIKKLDLAIELVTTNANKNLSTLKEYVKTFKNINLNIDSNNISEIISTCDIAIVTPSVMANEIVFFRIPFISIMVADNQLDMYDFLKEKGMPCLRNTEVQFLDTHIEQLYNRKNYNNQVDIIDSVIK